MNIRHIVVFATTSAMFLSPLVEASAQTLCSSATYCAGWENSWSGSGGAAVFGQADDTDNYGVFGNATGGAGVYGQDTSNGTGVYGISSSYYGVQGISSSGTGVYGSSASGTANGVVGTNSSYGPGVVGTSSTGVGVVGLSNGAAQVSGVGAGVLGQGTGSGIYGGYFASVNKNAVYGTSTNDNAIWGDITGQSSSSNAAVVGAAGSSGGQGVLGTASSSDAIWGKYTGTGSANGVEGDSTSSGGAAVLGSNTNGSGVGVKGSIDGTSSSAKAVWGYNSGTSGYAGYFTGNVDVTGTLTCGSGCSSDAKLKKNIEPLSGALDRILQLKGVTFEWKEPEKHDGHTGTQVGVIAQDVQKVQPQWVHERMDRDGNPYLTVDPDARTMVGLTVEGFRALKAENDDLKSRMDRMENGTNPPRAGFTFGNGGWAVAGVMFGALAFGRRKQQTA